MESRTVFKLYLILSKTKKIFHVLYCQGSALQNTGQPQLSEKYRTLDGFQHLAE